MTKRGRFALAATACVSATWLPLLIGAGLDLDPFRYWGVLSGYLGISWLLPGVFAGIATAEWARGRGRQRPKAVGIAVGIGAGVGLIVGWASLMVALGAEGEDAARKPVAPAVSDQRGRIALVSAAARRTKYAHVDLVVCGRDTESLCVVTYAGPACQLWTVENVNGVDSTRPLGQPEDGAHGTYNEESDSTGCFFDLAP
jgi:biotin transporter BioY